MRTEEIVNEIKKLPFSKKLWVVERAMQLMHKEEIQSELSVASDVLYNDYVNDKELTVFTKLDLEDFYEAR